MLQLLQFVATLSAALFASAALYINVAEHPARMRGDISSALAQWAISYSRARLLQAPLAIVASLASLAAWLFRAGTWWLVAGYPDRCRRDIHVVGHQADKPQATRDSARRGILRNAGLARALGKAPRGADGLKPQRDNIDAFAVLSRQLEQSGSSGELVRSAWPDST